jgi:protein involved in polysaccharide export with SLBB domain
MQKFISAILFALAVGANAAVAGPLRQTPSVRVGPLAEEQRAGGEAEAAPAKKGERPAAPSDAGASPGTSRREEARPANASEPRPAHAGRREPETARNGGSNAEAAAPSQPGATSSQPSPTASQPNGPLSQPGAAPAEPNGAPAQPNGAPAQPNGAAKAADPSNSQPKAQPTSQPPAPAARISAPADSAGSVAGERVSAPASASNAAPAQPPALPLTAVYRIGTGDVLDIRVLNMADARQSTLFTVLSGGVLEYPLLRDPLTVAGMTTEELSAQLVAELRHRGIYDRPQVRVSVREYASHAVLVSGLANDPGTKILRREAVPLYVVVAESQPKPEAGRAVVISHKTGQTTTVDLNDPAALNVLVQAGDVVNLVARPPAFLYIGGEIGSPGQKDFHAGMTLTQALLASGGVTRAAGPKVKVSRQGPDGRLVSTEYDLPDIEKGLVPDPALQPGDRVEVSRARVK